MKEKHILVVEDEWLVANDIKMSLKNSGFQAISIAATGDEAIKKTAELKPDLVLMDIVLRGELDGIQAARQIKDSYGTPVIFLTAYSDQQLLDKAKQTTPFGYIVKPFRERDLHTTIEMALCKHEEEVRLKKNLLDETKIRNSMERQLKVSHNEKKVLLEEIHHRVKNNMQVIYGLLDLQIGHVDEKRYIDIFKSCQTRILAMALIHDHLYQSETLNHVDFQKYIHLLAEQLLHSSGVSKKRVNLKISVTAVPLGIAQAIPCGLIINELVSNALAHAFPEKRQGDIDVSLLSVNEDEAELIVSDNGVGLPIEIDFQSPQTFGMQIINTYAVDELKGSIELDRTKGTLCRIRFKLRNYI